MKEKSKKMKPFASISIMFSLLLVVSVGYFWIGKSADKSRAEDAFGVKSVTWAGLAARDSGTNYTGAAELCRQVDSPESTGQWHGWHDCKRGSYESGATGRANSSFNFEQYPDYKQGNFYVHVKVLDGYGRYAIPQKYHYDPNGQDLVIDSYGLILTGNRQTWICDKSHYKEEYDGSGGAIVCDHDYLPTIHPTIHH